MIADHLAALRPLFDGLADGIFVSDSEGKLLYSNDAAAGLLGAAAEEAMKTGICRPLCGAIEGAPCGADASACPLNAPGGSTNSTTYRGKHAVSHRDLRVRCLKTKLSGAELRFVVIEDDAAEAELERHKDDWRHMLAHDVRNPLTMAMGALKFLEDSGAGHTIDKADLELIHAGVRNCRRIEELLATYLETDRMVKGSMPVHAAAVDAAQLISDLVSEHAQAAAERGLSLKGGARRRLCVRADPELLRRALTNLIDNALKYTPAGGCITVNAAEDRGLVRIRVADDGPGIPARDLPRIFDRYYQVSKEDRRHGLGLGLTFCRAALSAMDGEITVESRVGTGSVFTLTLPRAGEAP